MKTNMIKLEDPESEKTDILLNLTKRNYLILGSVNDKKMLDLVYNFMVHYNIWHKSDNINLTVQFKKTHMRTKLHDISFVLKFFEMAHSKPTTTDINAFP